MPEPPKPKQLIVEGKNDVHTILVLCKKNEVEETFAIIRPSSGIQGKPDGVEALINGLPLRLKQPGLEALGVVIDADINIMTRWGQIKSKLSSLKDYDYNDLPEKPDLKGVIRKYHDKPNIGIWLMPNNNECGKLEDFIQYLIPEGVKIGPKTEQYLTSIESENLNPYKINQRSKAFIHAWLACQKNPGMPMGQAITANILNHQAEIACRLVCWLNALFVKE